MFVLHFQGMATERGTKKHTMAVGFPDTMTVDLYLFPFCPPYAPRPGRPEYLTVCWLQALDSGWVWGQ